jgi:hypothetical protein
MWLDQRGRGGRSGLAETPVHQSRKLHPRICLPTLSSRSSRKEYTVCYAHSIRSNAYAGSCTPESANQPCHSGPSFILRFLSGPAERYTPYVTHTQFALKSGVRCWIRVDLRILVGGNVGTWGHVFSAHLHYANHKWLQILACRSI